MARSRKIGALFATLSIRGTQFTQGLRSAGSRLNNFTRSFTPAIGTVVKYGAALAAAGTTGAAVLLARQAKVVDQIAKTADKLGLGTEALIGLRHAAELTGVSTQALEMGLQRMVRRVSEVSVGTGEAQKAMAELGLDAKALNILTTDRKLLKIADALDNVTNQSDRLRLAQKLFDSEGVALVNTLAGGSAAIRAMMADAQALGITLTRVDARKVEMTNDAILRLRKSFVGFQRQVLVKVVPVIEELARAFTFSGQRGAFWGEILLEIFKNIAIAAGAVGRAWLKLQQFTIPLQALFASKEERKELRDLFDFASDKIDELSRENISDMFDAAIERMNKAARRLTTGRSGAGLLGDLAGGGSDFAGAILRGTQEDRLARFRFNRQEEAARGRQEQLAIQIERGVETIARQTAALQGLRTARVP